MAKNVWWKSHNKCWKKLIFFWANKPILLFRFNFQSCLTKIIHHSKIQDKSCIYLLNLSLNQMQKYKKTFQYAFFSFNNCHFDFPYREHHKR